MNISRKIDLRIPEGQLLKLLGFADEMLTMIEADAESLGEAELRASKELRHIINKVANIHREQTEYESTTTKSKN